jgi:DNA-binding MarR family transcriptional regulator
MAADPLAGIDETFHAPARLGIMTLLLQEGSLDFATLKRTLGLTDGNLGAHLRVLEGRDYIAVEKAFEGRKPRTTCRVTTVGRRAFARYLDALERVIDRARG